MGTLRVPQLYRVVLVVAVCGLGRAAEVLVHAGNDNGLFSLSPWTLNHRMHRGTIPQINMELEKGLFKVFIDDSRV